MKYRFFWSVVILGTVFCCGIIPETILAQTPTIEVAAVEAFEIQPEIVCSGVIEAENSCQLVAACGVVIEELWAQQGEMVEEGAPLVKTVPGSSSGSAFFFCDPQQNGISGLDSSQQLAALAALSGVDTDLLPDHLSALSEAGTALSQMEVSGEEILVAPFSGQVIQLTAKEGQYLAPGESLCTILGDGSYLATVQVPAAKADWISIGDPAEISGGEINGQVLSGTVCFIGSTVSRSLQGTALVSMVDVGVRIYPQQGRSIRHGAGVQCRILTGEPRQCLGVPYECVQQNERNEEFVFLVSSEGLSPVKVTTGEELADQVEISGPLKAGDLVAATGEVPKQYLLTEGENP